MNLRFKRLLLVALYIIMIGTKSERSAYETNQARDKNRVQNAFLYP